jgi:hypothetical protein
MCTATLTGEVLGFDSTVMERARFGDFSPTRARPAAGRTDPASFCASVRRLALRAHSLGARAHRPLSDPEIRELLEWISTLESQLRQWRVSRPDAFIELGGWIGSMRRWVSGLRPEAS